jgi:hypothetical protein
VAAARTKPAVLLVFACAFIASPLRKQFVPWITNTMHSECAMQAVQHRLRSELGISLSTIDPALQPSRKVALQVSTAATE